MSSERMTRGQAFKQFSLETERLEMTYTNLEERFKHIQTSLDESYTRLSGKLAELDFTSRYLETILNHISQGVLFIDVNGIVTTYNATARQILQIPEKEFLFHPFSGFFEDDFFGFSLNKAFDSKECPKIPLYKKWNRKGLSIELEIESTFVSMSQQAIPLDYRSPSSSLPVQGLLFLIRDITSLRMWRQAAEQTDRLKALGKLAAHLAHEIRNPIGGIKGFATLLHEDLGGHPDLQKMALSIMQGADDLSAIVSQVLQYARPFHLKYEEVDLIQLVEEIKSLLEADENWNSSIEFRVHHSLLKLTIWLDPHSIKSALINLFMNAVQAMPQGGKLDVFIDCENTVAVLRIEDTGEGIAPENLSKIFSPFFTTKENGNGLGLAEVHKVIQAHQGWIDVKSEQGKGTLFNIKLPFNINAG